MKIELTKKESEEIFFSALCNALGTGYMEGYGLVLQYDQRDYTRAKAKLKEPCFEDVLMQMLKDGSEMNFFDLEGEETYPSITIKDVYKRVKKAPLDCLMNVINEQDDAEDADQILQTVFCNEVIYG